MSKYVIELREDCEIVQQICSNGNGVRVGSVAVECLEELTAGYINEHFGDLQDTAYQKGFEDGKDVRIKGCEGCMYQDTAIEHNPCNLCCNAFLNRWTAKDGKIEVGDVVERYLNDKLDSTGIYLGEDGDYWNCLFWTGAVFGTFAYPKNQFKKTGRHFDIEKILEAMKRD